MENNQIYLNLLVKKLNGSARLTFADMSILSQMPMQITDIRADQDILREGDRAQRCCIILDGIAAWSNVTGSGRRQILNFIVAGDIPDLHSLHLEVLDSTLGTLTACRVGFIQHEVVREMCAEHPRIASYLWRCTLTDAAIFRQWVTNVGGRNAYSRLAHLLCETMVRLAAVGLSDGVSCRFPITQSELGEATGLSVVHVNRTLKQLRAEKLISLKDELLTIVDSPGLNAAADFDPTYLHMY